MSDTHASRNWIPRIFLVLVASIAFYFFSGHRRSDLPWVVSALRWLLFCGALTLWALCARAFAKKPKLTAVLSAEVLMGIGLLMLLVSTLVTQPARWITLGIGGALLIGASLILVRSSAHRLR